MEPVGAQIAVCLAQKVKGAMRKKFSETRYFTDSPAVLDILREDSASLLEFVGTHVIEIKTKSNPDEEWYWVPTDCNQAAIGIRPMVTLEEMGEQSDCQKGMDWTRCLEEEWPGKKTVTPPPAEECRKKMMLAVPVVVPTAEVAMMQAAKALQDLLPYLPLSAL